MPQYHQNALKYLKRSKTRHHCGDASVGRRQLEVEAAPIPMRHTTGAYVGIGGETEMRALVQDASEKG